MSSENAITVAGVSKHYRLKGRSGTLKSAILGLVRGGNRGRLLKALDEIDFCVPKGETLGIIGANGAGKSTLLSLLTGTIHPTAGTIETVGQISSLLELGAGFHPDLTGRENVFLYGAIMGLTRSQMTERFDAIVEFAGLHEFIDQPVKHYSSGMYVRLGFAVAVEVDPDILLIDEVLAVGDADFQRKCIAKMDEFRGQGKTMLIISHDLPTIQGISDRMLLLDAGRILGIGSPDSMMSQYESLNRKRNAKGLEREWGTGEATITGVELRDASGNRCETFQWGGALEARIFYETSRRIDGPVFGFAVSDDAGRVVHGSNTQIAGVSVPQIEGKGSLGLRLENLPMAKGTYLLSFSIHSADHKTNYHRLDNCFPIAVECDEEFEGYTHMPSLWRTEGL